LQPNRPPKHFSKCDFGQKSTIPTPRWPLYHIYIYICVYIYVCVVLFITQSKLFLFSQLARSWPPERMRHRRWGNKRVNDRFFFSPPKKKKKLENCEHDIELSCLKDFKGVVLWDSYW
jgi:hypothetical protein